MAAAFLPPFQAHPTPPTPPSQLRAESQIIFTHPGYPEPTNILLTLPRVDRAADSTSNSFGLHHRTALLACQIIAGNAFETGRFTLDKEGQHTVNIPLDGILTGNAYYFIVGDGPSKYPIVPSFSQYVSHIFSLHADELWSTCHNTIVQHLHDDSRPYLFARFAWTVLLYVKPFITEGFSRRVIRIQPKSEDQKIKREEESLSGVELKALYGDEGSKPAGSVADDDENSMELYEDDDYIDMKDFLNSSNDAMNDREDREGKKKEQMPSEETVRAIRHNLVSDIKKRLIDFRDRPRQQLSDVEMSL